MSLRNTTIEIDECIILTLVAKIANGIKSSDKRLANSLHRLV